MSKICIHKCINELQETKTAPGYYKNIVVATKTYKVGTAVRIIKESRSSSCYDTKDLRGKSGIMFKYCREENQWSHSISVYVLIDKFKVCGPLVVIKETPQSICKYGKAKIHKTAN